MTTQQKMICLGPAGSFSHQAARQFAKTIKCDVDVDFVVKNEDILPAIAVDPEAIGVIAVENTTAGFVLPVVRSWLAHHHANCSPINACGELWLPIEHCLLAKPETMLGNINTIMSHPQAIAQCQKFLGPLKKQTKEVGSTSLAAELVSRDESDQTAAIASTLAAELYDLKIFERGIQDQKDNKTHFLLLGRDQTAQTENDRTVLMFRLVNKAGSLERLLNSFSRRQINLSCIESIREGNGRSSLFYAEADCHIDGHDNLHDELMAKTTELVIMGSFPKAD